MTSVAPRTVEPKVLATIIAEAVLLHLHDVLRGAGEATIWIVTDFESH